MAKYTQDGHRIGVSTPLGKDELLLTHFSGYEEASRLFSYHLEMLSENDALDHKQIVGKSVSFWIEHPDGKPRFFNGLVSRFSYGGRGDRLSRYRMEVVPWLWFLTRKSDCRIFQNKTIPEIVQQVFKDSGFTNFEVDCKGSHPKWIYCVQYRETDFNFVSRLMEQEGIFYFFRHENGKHTMVLSDHKGAYKDCVDKDVQFAATLGGPQITDQLTSWEHQYEFRTGKFAQTDYNFELPNTDLMTRVNSLVKLPDNTKFEFYDYPGEYEKKGDGDSDTQIRMEEEEVPYDVVKGSGFCRSFSPGAKFQIKKHHHAAENGKGYVIVSVQHSASIDDPYETGGTGGFKYQNTFNCIPDSVTFRPARRTPKPVVHGSQTALVVGPSGEEIHTDEYGRIRVQFYWDRVGKKDEDSSCWIRCAQVGAGKGWGAMSIPRIGQEVVVSYLEGDPDRPLVTGVVYNADQLPAYKLPGEKTKTYIKTNTSDGGAGYNEIRFEDKKDKEQIFIHSQRNMDVRVKNDSMERILHDRHQIIGDDGDDGKVGDQREMVYQDKHLNVKRHQTEHIEGNHQLMVGNGEADSGGNLDVYVEKQANFYIGSGGEKVIIDGDRNEKVGGNQSASIAGNRVEKVAGSQSLKVAGDRKEQVMSQSLTVDTNEDHKVKMNHALEAGMCIHIKAGMTLVLEAGMQLSLKAGGSFIDIGPAGVAISGMPMVLINSGGAAGSGAGAQPQAPDEPQPPSQSDVQQAQPTEPTVADDSKTGQKSC